MKKKMQKIKNKSPKKWNWWIMVGIFLSGWVWFKIGKMYVMIMVWIVIMIFYVAVL